MLTLWVSLPHCLPDLAHVADPPTETVAPQYSSNFYKILGLIVYAPLCDSLNGAKLTYTLSRFLPTVFLPLSWLSITSMLGIVSSVLLIVVILIDGFTKVSTVSRRSRCTDGSNRFVENRARQHLGSPAYQLWYRFSPEVGCLIRIVHGRGEWFALVGIPHHSLQLFVHSSLATLRSRVSPEI
jgi:hypothetical protein